MIERKIERKKLHQQINYNKKVNNKDIGNRDVTSLYSVQFTAFPNYWYTLTRHFNNKCDFVREHTNTFSASLYKNEELPSPIREKKVGLNDIRDKTNKNRGRDERLERVKREHQLSSYYLSYDKGHTNYWQLAE